MKRSILLTVSLFAAAWQPAPSLADGTIWQATLGLGPTDATSVAARPGLLLAGGRKLYKNDSAGNPVEIAGPRTPGLFRSSDRGASWSLGAERVGEDLVPITATPDVVGLAPSSDGAAYAAFGTDLWRSDDQAVTWFKVSGLPAPATAIEVFDNGTIVAGLAGGGARMSGDLGQTWSTPAGLPSGRVNDLAIVVTTAPSACCPALLVATTTGVYRSTAPFTTFAQVTAGLSNPNGEILALGTELDAGAVLATPGSGVARSDIYHSQDSTSWSLRSPVLSRNLLPNVNRGALELTVQGSLYVVFAGTDRGLFRITSPGNIASTWTQVEPDPGSRPVGDIAGEDLDPGPGRNFIVYATVRRGSVLTHTSAQGAGWTAPGWYDEVEGGRICGGMVARPNGDLFAACGTHVVRSTDEGTTWQPTAAVLPLNVGVSTTLLTLGASADGSLWTSCYQCGLYRSNPTVTTWAKVPIPVVSVGLVEGHPTDPNTVFVAGGDANGGRNLLLRTTDGGTTWKSLIGAELAVHGITISSLVPDRVFVGTLSKGGWVSEDKGETWTQSVVPATGFYQSPVYSEANPQLGWAPLRGGSPIELGRTDDGGKTWVSVGPLPAGSFPQPFPSPWDADTLYVRTGAGGSGIAVTRDGGQTYEPFASGLAGTNMDYHLMAFSSTTPGEIYTIAGVLGAGADPPDMWPYRAFDPPEDQEEG